MQHQRDMLLFVNLSQMKLLSLLPACLQENFVNLSLYGQSFWMKMLVNGINLLHLPWAIQL